MMGQGSLCESRSTQTATEDCGLHDVVKQVSAVGGNGWRGQVGFSRDSWCKSTQRIALVVSRDEVLQARCRCVLEKGDLKVVTARSPAKAECRLRHDKVRAVVFDARILGPICQDNPGPILPAAAEIPFVVTNASLLDASRRAVVHSYRARCVESGTDTEGLMQQVSEGLLETSELDCSEDPERGELRIFLVDDDTRIRAWLGGALRDDGHSVVEYRSPSEVPAASFRDAAVVVTEYQMQGEDGLAFADQFHAACPTAPVIMVTAHWEPRLVTELTSRDFLYYLRKPVDYSVLQCVVRDLTQPAGECRTIDRVCQ